MFIGHSWGAMYATWFINEYGDYGGRLRGAILSEPGAFTRAELDAFIEALMGSVDLTGEQLNDAFWAGQFMSAEDHARADYMRGMLFVGRHPGRAPDPAKPAPFWRAGAVVNDALFEIAKPGIRLDDQPRAFGHKVLFLRGDLNTAPRSSSSRCWPRTFPTPRSSRSPTSATTPWERPDEYLAHARAYFQAIGFVGGAR